MRLSLFLAFWAIAILLAASSFYAYLNLSKFHTDLQRLEAERFAILAASLADVADEGLRLGLTLDQLDNLGPAIVRLKTRHPEIAGGAVLGETCEVLFGDRVGVPVPEDACRMKQRRDVVSLGSARAVFREIDNNFDHPVGAVMLLYPDGLSAAAVATATRDVIGATLAVQAIAGVLCLIGTMALVRRSARSYAPLAAALGSADGVPSDLDPGLAALVAAGNRHAAAIEHDLALLECEMREAA